MPMESIKLFLQEVTEELLYNIVCDEDEIHYRILSDRFQEKTGHRPMDFFGLGNITGKGWFNFIKGIPGVEGTKMISMVDYSDSSDEDSEDDGDGYVYRIFNYTSFDEGTVANYREMILMRCCQIIKTNFADLSNCSDEYGNTPLHFIAALPGVSKDCDTLVKYLLEAGVDPLATNDDGKTFLHVIFGGFKAAYDWCNQLRFTDERVPKTEWFVEDRAKLLQLLSEELPEKKSALLAKIQDNEGNSVLHEYAFNTTVEGELVLCEKLLNFGASLRIPNNFGEVPLHYANTAFLFKIFLLNGAVCHARNDRDETPVLFILKKIMELAYAQTSAAAELADQGYVKITRLKSLTEAKTLLEQLIRIVSENVATRITSWIPDLQGNTVVHIALIAIRVASYNVCTSSGHINIQVLPGTSLMQLLREILPTATPSDIKRQNKKGQTFLHVLLDMGDDNNKHTIIEPRFILNNVQALLDYQVGVNALDARGCTPLDITLKYFDRQPSFYKNCADLLIKHGAIEQCNKKESRRLRECPKRHKETTQSLIKSSIKVTVVEKKYRYSNQFLIGTGAFSSVFIAIKDEHVESSSGKIECRAYALKRLDKAKINPEEIKREITTLLTISHKNVIKCHEALEDNFFQYLCLELMDGDLLEFVNNENVNKIIKKDPSMHDRVAKGVVEGLVYLHEKKFIHRDLKPGNILYTTEPTLHFKIADFGLTKNLSTSCTITSTRGCGVAMAPGTRCWMAPELLSMRSKEHTKESDIFSLGLVLHYLRTLGKHPFATRNEEPPHVIERKIVDMQISFDSTLHPEAISFFQVLLTKDSSKRPPAAQMKQHPFLWSEVKKIEFLKAVGDQPEAEHPLKHVNSDLEKFLQTTKTGRNVAMVSWESAIQPLYDEMTRAWRQKKYRTDKVIDLLRFIRNAYSHRQDRLPAAREYLDKKIFLRVFPSLLLDVFDVVQQLGFADEEDRSNIREALSFDT